MFGLLINFSFNKQDEDREVIDNIRDLIKSLEKDLEENPVSLTKIIRRLSYHLNDLTEKLLKIKENE